MKSVYILLLVTALSCAYFPEKGYGQFSTYGVDFYVGILRSLWNYKKELTITTRSVQPVNFTVELGIGLNHSSTGWYYTGTVSVDSPALVILPDNVEPRHGNYSERFKGIHIYSNDDKTPISVVVMTVDYYLNAEYLAYPYINMGQEQYIYYVVSTNSLWGLQSLFLLVGNEDNTTITIIPTQMIEVPEDPQDPESLSTIFYAGNTYTISLHLMQTLLIGAEDDLTGTQIISNKPLTVISGHECGIVSLDQWWNFLYSQNWWWAFPCGYLTEQIPPTVTWGKQFLLVPFPEASFQHYTKIVASEEETTVTLICNNTLVNIILLTFASDWMLTNTTVDPATYCAIVSDKPILVSQLVSEGHVQETYLNATDIHETLSIVPPVEQYINAVTYVPLNTSFTDGFDHHYIHITTTNTNNVLLDDELYNWDWEPIHSGNGDIIGYGTVHEFDDTLPHVLRHTDITAGLSVIGYGSKSYNPSYDADGYAYLTGMNLNIIDTGVLQLNPWYGHILGGVPVILTGPSYIKPTDKLYCLFDGIKVDGVYVSQTQVLCVTPRLTKTGRVSVQLFHNGFKYPRQSSFYSKRIEDDSHVGINSNKLLFYVGDDITLTWSTASLTKTLEDVIAPSDLLVDIKLHIFQITNDIPTLEQVATLDSNVANTGSVTVKIPTISHSSNQSVYTVIISIEAKGGDPQNPTLFDKVQKKVTQWTDIIWIVSTNKQSSGTKLWSACKAWSISEPSSIGQQLLDKVRSDFPCPPTIGQARTVNSGLIEDRNTKWREYLHPKANKCFHQRTITKSNEGSGNQCCYGNNGNLIVGPTSGGSVDKVSTVGSTRLNYLSNLIKHQFEDILPYIFCCKGTQTSCDIYYKRRPSDDGSAYTPPIPACVYGDPHVVTLDLHKYTFNGKGEFVLIETNDQSFTLQGRMIEVKDSIGSVAEATVFSACVAKEESSSTVQFEIEIVDNITSMITLIDRERINFDEIKSQEFNNVTVTDSGNNTLSATFSSGAFLLVQEQNGFISVVIVSLPESFKSKTKGLMGPYNGDKTDDLIPKGNGTILSLNSTLQEIHEKFGITWIIDDPSDSLFTYKFGQDWSAFYFPDFSPVYEPQFNDSTLEDKANKICGDDLFCKFDIAATGRVEIGEATYQGGQDFEQLVNLSKPINCKPPCVHGACVDTNVCACGEGYEGNSCNTTVYSPCDQNPCNGGTCQYHAGSYICHCLPSFTGVFCEDEVMTPTVSSDDNNVDVIVGVVVGLGVPLLVIVITVIIIILVVSLRMKTLSRNKKDSAENTYEDMTMGNTCKNIGMQNMKDSTEKGHIKH